MIWLVLAGLGILAALEAMNGPVAAPPAGTPPGVPPPRGVPRPSFQQIDPVPEELFLEPGTTYLAEADVPSIVDLFVGRDDIVEALEKEGFIVIRVDRTRPSVWPDQLGEADWFIIASYSGASGVRKVPSQIDRLWKAVAS